MGSFNTTCFASQQTIARGDRCYVLPLRQAASYLPVKMRRHGIPVERYAIGHMDSSPLAAWEPAGNFIEAVYDDYGRVKPLNSACNHHRLESFFRSLMLDSFQVDQSDNPIQGIAFDFPGFVDDSPELKAMLTDQGIHSPHASDATGVTLLSAPAPEVRHQLLAQAWRFYEEAARRLRVFLAAPGSGEPRQAYHAIIHVAAFEQLIDFTENLSGHGGHAYTQRTAFEELLPELERRKASTLPDRVENAALLFGLQFERIGYSEGLEFADEASLFEPLVEGFFNENLSEDDLYEALRPSLDSRFVMLALSRLNLRLTPMKPSGQDSFNRIGEDYARFVLNTFRDVSA